MRIFHVSDCYAPRTGGIESQVRDLARAQVRAGHQVHVLTATVGPAGERAGTVQVDDGVQVHRLATRAALGLPVNPGAPPRVRSLLTELSPDVVHVHAGVVSPFAFDGARVALGHGVPLAITWHCMLDGVTPALRSVVRRSRWSHAPAALSAVSSAAAGRVGEVFEARVAVVPNGMDLDRWTPGPLHEPGPLRCVATMRLAPRKRGVALVDAVADAMTQLAPGSLTLDLVGDGPERASISRRVARRGLGAVVRLRGRLPREDVREAYRSTDVFLAPAELEAFGIAALEARAAGLVVVARRGTGIEEFVTDGHDGLVVDDDAGLSRALVALATRPRLLEELRSRARAERPVFDWQHAQEAAEREYARATALRAGPA
ncbi:glycosyltransferase family 4 protein [Actinotalea sp. BY-33]|uniref:D-inositol 3-phosphate glycosyltransferase n=1 Tax=Actinotalea soli TaxID=2819234 RepID=A0A939LQM5_9CELL|nr:glycosyltransferase family 4 protein [Actinotalea soli]MBO1752264.1 glycosyltransferase family 4 protein [Actinotalea soli]